MSKMGTIALATAVAGSLDIASAFVFAGLSGTGPATVLGYVASGPFGGRALAGGGWPAAGLGVHFAIMTCMVATYVIAADRAPVLTRRPVAAGLSYGLLLWIVMYWVVKPIRWPDASLPHTLWGIGNALFSHCLLVGLPIALITSRSRSAC